MSGTNNGKVTRIVMVISSLGSGGAERVMTMLAGELARRGYAVTIITLAALGNDFYEVDSRVRRVGLDLLGASRGVYGAVKSNVKRVARLRAAVRAERPQVIISFMDSTNVLTLLATTSLRATIIVSERIDPRYYPIARGWDWLRKKLYPTASAVVVQTSAVARWARDFMIESKVKVIPNPVEPQTDLPDNGECAASASQFSWFPTGPYIVAMGRLDKQKGFDLLLQVFANLAGRFSDTALIILGEGGERNALQEQAESLGIADRVIMPGRIKNPSPVLAASQCFVLSSRFEGFPNALLEAMAARAACVSFDCPSGPADIIRDGENGLLVEAGDMSAMTGAIERLLSDAELRLNLGNAARRVADDYSLECVTDQWERLWR